MNQSEHNFLTEKENTSNSLFLSLLKERANGIKQNLIHSKGKFLIRKRHSLIDLNDEILRSSIQDKALEKEGKNQQEVNQATKKALDKQTIDDLVKKSNRVIISISSKIFPWDFFPDTIVVEESRVTFIFRQFLSSQSHSVDLKDISNVFIESSLFLATLQVVSQTYIQNDIKIGHLKRKEAENVRRIIEGLRTFIQNNIDTSNYEIDELIEKIEEFHINKTVDGR